MSTTTVTRVHLGTDHAGFPLAERLREVLPEHGYEVIDHGALTFDAEDDYPSFCIAAAEATLADAGSLGVVLGGSGNGEQMAANLVRGIRCALAWNEETARLAREHNNAQVVSIGARMHDLDTATRIVLTFLGTPFSDEPRHQRRIDEMAAYAG